MSDNAGRLKNDTDVLDAYIPYSLTLDGTPVDLRGPSEMTMMWRTAGPAFVDVQFRIDPSDGPLWAGTYTDIVTISLSAY
jgi:hypothetical protein